MSAPFVQEIKQLLVTELNLQGRRPDEIDEQEPLFGGGLGLDSLDALQIAMVIEDQFGVRIPEGDEARPIFRNVASLAAHVAASQPSSPLAGESPPSHRT